MRRLVPLALFASLAFPGIVAAQGQTCVLLPRAEDSTAPADAHARVDATITEELRAHGLVVMASRDAQLRMADQPMEGCADIDCAPDVNRFLGTTFAVLTELTWLRGRPTMINVVLIGLDDGVSAGGQAVIERGGDLATAVRTAFSTAWDRWQADAQGQLQIDTTPPGAFVEIDGTSVGRSPIRQLVATGVHTVRVALDGYVTETREVTLDRHEERALVIELAPPAPEPTPPPVAVTETFEDQPHWSNWVIGGGAIALAIGLSISPIWTAATAGELIDHGAAGTETVVFDAQSAALAVIGGALLIGGVVFLVLHPITERVRVGVGPTSVGVEGTW